MSSIKWWIAGDNIIKVWKACKGRTHIVEAATIRARMMTGKYILQTTRSRYNQYKVDATCPLCESMDEDMTHLLVVCTELHSIRSRNREKLRKAYDDEGTVCSVSDREWYYAILNGGEYISEDGELVRVCEAETFDILCSRMCYDLHVERDKAINMKFMNQAD